MEANESLAYIAGIIDGEGSISIACSQMRGRYRHSIRLSVNNTCEALIDYVSALFPGSRSTLLGSGNHRTVYTVQWHGRSAINIIELVLPYLIVKKPVAEVVLDMWERCFLSKNERSAVSEANMILRNSYRERVKGLNRRGADS